MDEDLKRRSNRIINILQRGINHYLNNWESISHKRDFPIKTNEENYMANHILKRFILLQCCIQIAQTEEEKELTTSSLVSMCDYGEDNYEEYFQEILDGIAPKYTV